MSLQTDNKLKKLSELLPEGVVAPSSWLSKQGYSPQLVYKYVQNGWLMKIGHGAFSKPESRVEWKGAVLALQRLSNLPFYVGGITALNLQGYAHYLPMGNKKQLYIYGNDTHPAWIKYIQLSETIRFYKKPYFGESGLKKIPSGIRDWELIISSPERAIMEVLYLVEKEGITFQYVSELFEGLSTLRPSLVSELLKICDSIKVKRLFLFLSRHYNHPWNEYLEIEGIDLGKGKLQIVKDGVFDKNFLITVPKEFNHG
ncbi:MAG: type IV toxin-antitoxin system AbiEi family antitoxin domain-containing protein [Sulfuricurvum sp.]|uniref:type IV toxin-antitoxin system AbiEi family antitoxin domain-containing protein n=1 Tax=Sulfuricurvum sp. TaxID=2025608 RepID=UPI002634D9A3|nr:type IV toxin-antitoxin system AbiEi family antitoxin domain-containing protein [Sulfuricurvum sp.]MDD2829825.1 type IV toxin-antitoxin system AbiEi family antitoxin domain-containing protein [Sulfuricurvum sp.]MDD4950266.1 type IV toxin-antitoxin system AbiEi family antitoxin domain-containing protein [Sulfuricurvum sp.]